MQKVRRLYRPTAFFLGFPVLFQLSFNFPSQYYFTIGISFFFEKGGGAPIDVYFIGGPTGSPVGPSFLLFHMFYLRDC